MEINEYLYSITRYGNLYYMNINEYRQEPVYLITIMKLERLEASSFPSSLSTRNLMYALDKWCWLAIRTDVARGGYILPGRKRRSCVANPFLNTLFLRKGTMMMSSMMPSPRLPERDK